MDDIFPFFCKVIFAVWRIIKKNYTITGTFSLLQLPTTVSCLQFYFTTTKKSESESDYRDWLQVYVVYVVSVAIYVVLTLFLRKFCK